MKTIYLSSTEEDLREHRAAAKRAIERLNHHVSGMESYVPSPAAPIEKCLKDIAECDIYVGLFAHRYGSIPTDNNPDRLAFTELEFRQADRLKKPVLIFLLDPEYPWQLKYSDQATAADRGTRIDALRSELADKKLTAFFKSPESLASLVTAAVALQTQQTIVAALPRPTAPEPRQIAFDLYLSIAREDQELTKSLIANLRPEPERCSVQLGMERLFSRTPQDFAALDTEVCSCASAAVLVSERTLNRMQESPRRAQLVLKLLAARTGSCLALATSSELAPKLAGWEFTQIIDLDEFIQQPAVGVRHLKSTLKQVGSALTPPRIGLPWLVAAMTREEAASLSANPDMIQKHFGEGMRREFDRVCGDMAESFTSRYHETRELWHPPGSDVTIAELSADCVAGLVSSQNTKLRGRELQLQNYPFDALIPNTDELNAVYRFIADTGCVMIVDELSLFHPSVHDALQRSPMITAPNTAIVSVSPFDLYALPSYRNVQAQIRQRLSGAFRRFADDYDPQCELSVGNERLLRRWLYQSLPETLETLRNPRPSREALRVFAEQQNLELDAAGAASFYAPGGVL